MEVDVGFGADFPDLFDRLDHSGFIIRQHDGDQLGVGPERAANIVRINQAAPIHRKKRDFDSQLLQMLAGVQHGMMLDGRT